MSINNSFSLEDFVDRLVLEKGLSDLSGEVLDGLKADLMDRLEDRINIALLDNIRPERLEDFEKVVENGTQDEIDAFSHLPSNVVNFEIEELLAAELLSFREAYLAA